MKSGIRLHHFIPPIIYKIKRKLFPDASSSPVKLYASFKDALKECGMGYEDEELITFVFEKSRLFFQESDKKPYQELSTIAIHSILAVLIASKNKSEVNVIDVGGSFGVHYFAVRRFLNSDIQINWKIVESKGMVSKGKKLERDELKFYDSIRDALMSCEGPIDLIHCSGALQYVPEPYELLVNICESKARYLLLSRLNVTNGIKDIISIQHSMLSWNGPGKMAPAGVQDRWIGYPVTVIQKTKFLEMLSRNYKIKFSFEDKSGSLAVNKEVIEGFGVLCELRNL